MSFVFSVQQLTSMVGFIFPFLVIYFILTRAGRMGGMVSADQEIYSLSVTTAYYFSQAVPLNVAVLT